jgi:hypothetical protein
MRSLRTGFYAGELPFTMKNVENKLSSGANFQRVQIIRGDSETAFYTLLRVTRKRNSILVTQTGELKLTE